jgi:hypothetical protein
VARSDVAGVLVGQIRSCVLVGRPKRQLQLFEYFYNKQSVIIYLTYRKSISIHHTIAAGCAGCGLREVR